MVMITASGGATAAANAAGDATTAQRRRHEPLGRSQADARGGVRGEATGHRAASGYETASYETGRRYETEQGRPSVSRRKADAGSREDAPVSRSQAGDAMTEQVMSQSQRWARAAPRDHHGRFAPKAPLDAAGEADRQRRIDRDRALRAQVQDQRTRIARRARAIERQLREMLRRQSSKPITVDVDLTIGQIAAVAVRLEILRAEQSRGIVVDADKVSRLANTIARALARLRLKPTMFDEEDRAPSGRFSRARWDDQEARKAAQSATREASEQTTTEPPDGRAAAE
jgi:hypothetical protein